MKNLAILLSVLVVFNIYSHPSWAADDYIGCFRDQGAPSGTIGRDLSGAVIQGPNMTPGFCIEKCKERGFNYAGVQYSSFCFCGNEYGDFGVANNCDMQCAGNNNEICGGSWANSVYSVSLQVSPKPDQKITPQIDPSLIKKMLTCIGFQNDPPSDQERNDIDYEAFRINASSGANIISLPAPYNKHAWVPDQLHFLSSEAYSKLETIDITFDKPTSHVELSLARGLSNVRGGNSICASFYNSQNHSSELKCHDAGTTVKTMTFTSVDKVRRGGGEFQPPEEWYPAGDISRVHVPFNGTELLIWNICYLP